MRSMLHVAMDGPLNQFQEGYEQHLSRFGFSVSATKRHLYLMAHLSRWMKQKSVSCAGLNTESIERFFIDRRAMGYVRFRTPQGLSMLMSYLREQNIAPELVPVEISDAVDLLLEKYLEFLSSERGLSSSSIVGYRRIASSFLQTCRCESSKHPYQINVIKVHAFIDTECSRLSIGSANNVVTVLRSLLRFLYLDNAIVSPMAESVLRAATWRDPGLSRALSEKQVNALKASCDRRTRAGRRDFAIITVLAHTGLRSAEVASMTLEGMDWQAGEFTFTGKGNRQEKFPLLFDVGKAIADYCRYARPENTCRTLFLNGRAPFQAISAGSVSHVVLRASERAGISPVRAHQLRHSAASAMRRSDLPMFQISQVLRHQHSATTAVYAKEGAQALTDIARSWPGSQL